MTNTIDSSRIITAEGAEAGYVVIDAADLGLELVELLAQARGLDVEALHLVAELVDLALPGGVGLLQLVHQIGHGVDAAPDVPDLLALPLLGFGHLIEERA